MPDKRPVDELSIEELERILAIRKREARQSQLARMKHTGRVIQSHEESPMPQPISSPIDAGGLPAATIELGQEKLQRRKVVPEFEDAIDVRDYKEKNSRSGKIWRSFLNRSLLLLEVAAVVGLVVLGVALFNGLNLLEEETAAAQAAADEILRAGIPTIEPTPELQISNVVLPTGHTFLNNVPVFNFGEVPQAMQGLIYDQILLPADVARVQVTDDTPIRVIIPKLNIDAPIVQGVDWGALQQGVGMLPTGAVPRNSGDNVVLAAHNDIYGQIFRYLDQLEAGDELQVQTRSGVYTYVIRAEGFQVEPNEVSVMDSQNRPMVTLISCYPYQVNTHRIIVYADRVDA